MSTPEPTEPYQLAQEDRFPPPGERVATPSPGVQADQYADSTAAVEEVIYVANEDCAPEPIIARAGSTAAPAADDDDEDEDMEPDAAPDDVIIGDVDVRGVHSPEPGNPVDSDFLPDADDESDSEGEDPSTYKKSQKRKVPESQLEDLHAKWNNWEPIFMDLKNKVLSGASLSDAEEEEFKYSRKKLQPLLDKLPASDPMFSRYTNILAPVSPSVDVRKRASDVVASGQRQKARVGVPTRTQAPNIRKKTSSTADNTKPKKIASGQGRVPGTRKDEASKELTSEVVELSLDKFQAQATEAHPELDPDRLASEVLGLQAAAKHVRLRSDLAGSTNNAWLIRGMKSTLYDYQFSGVGWMLWRERARKCPSPYNPKGGILADAPGCGKTITMLAVIMANPAFKSDKTKANLLLVQNEQLIKHWKSQIEQHCEEGSLATTRLSRETSLNAASLNSDLVVMMSYGELERLWNRVKQARKKKEKAGKLSANDEAILKQDSLIFDVTFHRLILDECHKIKNHNTKTAQAIFEVKSKIQWLISATPAPNDEEEYRPYLKVLGLENVSKPKEFSNFWLESDGSSDDRSRLEVGLERFQLIRTPQTKIAGASILDVAVASNYSTEIVNLFAEERSLYNLIMQRERTRAAQLKEQAVTDGTEKSAAKLKAPSRSRILQLYKLTAHPFLLETMMDSENFTLDQHVEVQLALKRCDKAALDRLIAFSNCDQGEVEESDEPVSTTDSQSQSRLSNPTSDDATQPGELNMKSQLAFSRGKAAIERKCHMCPEKKPIPIDAVLTQCGHAFCKKHFKAMVRNAKEDAENESDPILCGTCEEEIGITEEVDQTDLAEAYAAYIAAETPKGRGGKAAKTKDKEKERGDDYNGFQPWKQCSKWLELHDNQRKQDPSTPLTQSAKTARICEIITQWQKDSPDDKIILFTQWILMGRIMGRHLEDLGINFLYYFGEMSSNQRDKNFEAFKEDKNIKVFIMGFKCGGEGLDMHFANRVILCDPYWNLDGETQAFSRVLRKVQKKPTFCVRMVAENSIDDRISVIQKAKQEMTEALRKEWCPKEMEKLLKKLEDALYSYNEEQTGKRKRKLEAGESQKDTEVVKKKRTTKTKRVKLNISKASSSSNASSASAKPKTPKHIMEKEDEKDKEDAMEKATETARVNNHDGLFVED